MIAALLLSLSIFSAVDEETASDDEFTFYLTEFAQHELPKGDAMAQLITDRLVDATFNTANTASFKNHIQQLKVMAKANPIKADRFASLDTRLAAAFEEKLKAAQHKRLFYTAGGAVVGAIVGIPIGNFLSTSTSMGSRIMLISIPAAALAGAGAGYLLGGILEVPDYTYEPGTMTRDLDFLRSELEETN